MAGDLEGSVTPAAARVEVTGAPNRPGHDGAEEAGFSVADIVRLAHALPDGILVVDASGVIRFVNARICELTGYSETDLVGHPVDMLVPTGQRQQHAAYRAAFVATPSTRSMGGDLDITCLRADGTEFEADIALSTFDSRGGRLVLAAVRDASTRKAAERARREMEERFHLLVDTVRDYAIFILDPAGNVASWNAGAERLKGYKGEEIIGKHYSIFHTPEDVETGRAEVLLRQAVTAGRVEETGWRVRKDGSRFQAMVTITALKDSLGTLRGFAKITRDVTEVQRARDDLERLRLLEQREKLGRDLHDGVIQSIFAVGMRLQSVLPLITDPEAVQRIDTAITELDTTIRDVRAYIFQLGQQHSLEALDAELRQLAADHEMRTGMPTAITIDEKALAVMQPHASAVLLVAKEALSNVARHSGAATVRVSLHRIEGGAALEIDDDGHGFDTSVSAPGLGIVNARARAHSAGGRYEVESGPEGTIVRLTITPQESPPAGRDTHPSRFANDHGTPPPRGTR